MDLNDTSRVARLGGALVRAHRGVRLLRLVHLLDGRLFILQDKLGTASFPETEQCCGRPCRRTGLLFQRHWKGLTAEDTGEVRGEHDGRAPVFVSLPAAQDSLGFRP